VHKLGRLWDWCGLGIVEASIAGGGGADDRWAGTGRLGLNAGGAADVLISVCR
jgi:hypothetical protein